MWERIRLYSEALVDNGAPARCGARLRSSCSYILLSKFNVEHVPTLVQHRPPEPHAQVSLTLNPVLRKRAVTDSVLSPGEGITRICTFYLLSIISRILSPGYPRTSASRDTVTCPFTSPSLYENISSVR